MVETHFNMKIKVVRSDSWGEYMSRELKEYFADQGINHQHSCPHQPQENGVAKRKHRHITETTRALWLHAHLPKVFWAECVNTMIYLINRLPTAILNKISPFE